jgi:hypothetical protein
MELQNTLFVNNVSSMSQLSEGLFNRMDYDVKKSMLLLESDLYSFAEETCLSFYLYKLSFM